MSSIGVWERPQVPSATSQDVEVSGTIILRVRNGEAHVQVVSRIVKNSAVSVLLETSFFDKFEKENFYAA